MKLAVPIEEYLKGPQMLKGRGRENYNPVFINPKKMFHVKTNKFKELSEEHFIAKREVQRKAFNNPFLPQNNFKSKQQQDLFNGYKRDPLYNKKYEGMFAGKYSNAVNYPKKELEDPIMRISQTVAASSRRVPAVMRSSILSVCVALTVVVEMEKQYIAWFTSNTTANNYSTRQE
ncbi:hypothetical protein J6590_016133 [Homalodisca vitripennis]|nr:hypothetical protein J6590_016133 [Homalodisca vitripennis]